MSISVIIPTFNSSKTIQQTLESVFAQTYKPSEIIIVDDCSIDNTHKICRRLLSKRMCDYKVCVLNEQGGPSKARNKGWSLARSKWIAFLDSDDIWHKTNSK
jgi:Glycosyltransferases involved in cell wall biogenesis